jgi:hypothetical protein
LEDALGIVIGILVTLGALLVLGWLGLKIKPKPFDPYPAQTAEQGTIPLPEDLPPPVKRFYQAIYGKQVPVIKSAVISGRAHLRPFGITFPGRFRFTYQAGKEYRHYLETTIFGLAVMKVNEHYLGGKSCLKTPFGVIENEPKVDQAANLGLWAESIWLPSILITDPRVRWESVDEHTALLRVPFGGTEETFVIRFDPQTGLLRFLESMRYRQADDQAKILWINEAREWQDVSGTAVLPVGAVTWFDQGTPWAVFTVEEVVYNSDVSVYIQATGP